MKKIVYMTALAATGALCACHKTEMQADDHRMRFHAEYPSATRATASAFESGDVMSVYVTEYDGEVPAPLQISGNYANNVKVIFNGSAWTPEYPVYWTNSKFDVYACYPYIANPHSVDECDFAVALDQSAPKSGSALGGYEASDFMWAKSTGITQMASVPLTFRHRLSRIIVNLVKGSEYDGDIPDDAVVRILNTVPEATIDFASGFVTKHPYGTEKIITANKLETGVYAAIIVPQRFDTRRPFIEVVAKGVSYMVESSFVFKTATQHTVNLTLDNAPDKVKIEIGGEIEGGWNE